MSFCDIRVRRTSNGIQVLKENGQESVLFPKLVEYTTNNDVYSGREWFFDKLIQQGKLQDISAFELALGLYSIAFHSGGEDVWLNKIESLLPQTNNSEIDLQDVELERQKILKRFGIKGSEINPNAEWGKLLSAIAGVNKAYGKVLDLYNAPNGKWYLRQSKDRVLQPVVQKTNGQQVIDNAKEFNLEVGSMEKDLFDNWSNYFPDWSYFDEYEKQQIIDLVKQGLLEISCKL